MTDNLPKYKYSDIKARSTVDILLRTTQQTHALLSQMADQKANIIIAASSIILTLALSNLGLKDIQYGLATLAFFTMISSVMAILAVMPLFSPTISGKKIKQRFNPVFFGHFAKFSREEFEQNMIRILTRDETTYETLVNDIYQAGRVLYYKKYRYLRLSYSMFLAGIILSVIVMAIQKIYF